MSGLNVINSGENRRRQKVQTFEGCAVVASQFGLVQLLRQRYPAFEQTKCGGICG